MALAQPSTGQPARAADAPQATDPEPPGRPARDEVTRPVPLRGLDVPYPDGQTAAASVVLELVIGRDGTVQEVTVVSGVEPFASSAAEAARRFEFEPARRAGEPVVARIRMEVRFTPPQVESAEAAEPSDPDAARTSPATPRPAPSAPAVEILVLGDRAPPARMTLGRAEVRELPGAFGDPFRAVEVMPGVTPIFTGIPFFYVRGSPPGNVGYFLDGIRVPLLFHVALGPSVIHPGVVDRVDLYPGGYPARYGRFAGAVVSAESTAPTKSFRAEGNIRIFDAGALAEAPFADGRGTFLLGGRYSYTAAVLSLFAPEVTLAYWDYQVRGSYEVSPEWRLGAFSFGAFDLFRSDEEDSSVGTQFHRLDLRADYTPSPATALRFAVTLGLDRSGARESDLDEGSMEPTLQDKQLATRLELEHQLSPNAKLRAGADLVFDRYEIVDLEEEDAGEVFYTRVDTAFGARGDVVWEPEPGVVITPGLRADVYGSAGQYAFALEPRIAAEFWLSRAVTVEHTFGIAHQAPSFIVPIPGFQLSDLRDGLQQALQSSAGVVVRPGGDFQLSLTLFHNAFMDLTDFLGTFSVREQAVQAEDDDERLDIRSIGQAYGFELMIKRALTRKLGGYFAYTLSRSTRSLGRASTVANFDRTHVLHAALSYDLGRRWRAGARLSMYTGVPAQRELDEFTGNPFELVANPAYRRGPPFYRLDLRLEKRWPLGKKGGYWAFVVEMLNSTLHREVPFYTCRASGCEGEAIGPVTIPSIGVELFY